MLDTRRASRRRDGARRPGSRGGGGDDDGVARGCAHSSSRSSGDKGVTSPVVYPKSDDSFPQRLAGLAALLAAGLPLRLVALSAPGSYDTHADQAGDLADRARR